MNRLSGKVIVVAGCGGIGSELARRYAAEGASIVLGDIDAAAAQTVVDEIAATGGIATATALDGGDEASIYAIVDLACATYGGLDGFHANYASFADGAIAASVLDMPMDVYDEVMRVNARGHLLCTRAALPKMIERGGGVMLYTSSGSAYVPMPIRPAYAMSKSAIHALMRTVAIKHGLDGIRANVIAPGIIMHEKLEANASPGLKEWAFGRNAVKARLGRPADIAATGAMLMSDEGAYITGQVLSIDGGSSMRQ